MTLSSRFDDALLFARQLHASQTRKGTIIPYLAHLLSVTALVLESGGDEDEAIAALLHDAVEDQGGLATLAEIRHRYGERVAAIVEGCTDALTSPKPPWRQRKESHLSHLESASPEVRRVSLADKLHNARTIRSAFRLEGPAIWHRFGGGKDGTLWYYRRLVEIFGQNDPKAQVEELAEIVAEIESMAESY